MKKLVGLALILAGLVLGLFGLPMMMNGGSPNNILDNLRNNENTVTEKLTDIAEASVLEYDYSNAIVLNDYKKIFKTKIKIPFTGKKLVVTYDGKMKLGADVSKLEISIDKKGGKVSSVEITMPEIVITSHEIDRSSMAFPIEKSSLINSIKTADLDEIEQKAKDEIEKDVKGSSVMKEAEQEFKESVTGYLTALYGEEVEVVFK